MPRSATVISIWAATRPISSARSSALPILSSTTWLQHYQGLLGNKQLGVGAVDVQDPKIETGRPVAARIRAHNGWRPSRLSSPARAASITCPEDVAFGKLKRWPRPNDSSAVKGRDGRSNLPYDLRQKKVRTCSHLPSRSAASVLFEWQVPSRHGSAVDQVSCDVRPGRVSMAATKAGSQCVYREDNSASETSSNGLSPRRPASSSSNSASPARPTKRCAGSRRGASPSTIGGQKPVRVVGVNVDVTDRKRALLSCAPSPRRWKTRVRERTRELEAENEARKKAESRCVRRRRWKRSGQLTGGVAHDFNNLLTIIIGGLEAIGRQIPELAASPQRRRHDPRTRNGSAGRAAGGDPDQPTAGLLAPATAGPEADRCQQARRRHIRTAARHPRRNDRRSKPSCRRALACQRRCQPAGERAGQPRGQCARRNAGRRQGHDRNGQLLTSTGLRRRARRAGRRPDST